MAEANDLKSFKCQFESDPGQVFMNKEKLKLLHLLLEELKIHLNIQFDMGKKAGGTLGHKYGSRLKTCKDLITVVKNMLTVS